MAPVTRVVHGHCIDRLNEMRERSVHICITSPPYYGLRDYKTEPVVWGGKPDCKHKWGGEVVDRSRATPGIAGSGLTNNGASQAASARFEKRSAFCQKCGAWRGNLGLEPTVELYVEHLVECFQAVWRVLRDDGTFWLNLGDSYSSGGRDSYDKTRVSKTSGLINNSAGISRVTPTWAKPKDLLGIPWMAAFALRSAGWYLRQRIPWIKRNPMPESTEDRPSTAIEEVFLFSKSERYFYDGEAVKIPMAEYEMMRRLRERSQGLDTVFKIARDGETGIADQSKTGTIRNAKARGDLATTGVRSRRNSDWFFDSWRHNALEQIDDWQGMLTDETGFPLALVVNTAPFRDAHFATFPPKLVQPMILSGTSARGACEKCGAPWARIVETGEPDREHQRACGSDATGEYNGEAIKDYESHRAQNASDTKRRILEGMMKRETVGWHPTCICGGYEVKSTCSRRIGEPPKDESPHEVLPNSKFTGRSNAQRLGALRDSMRAGAMLPKSKLSAARRRYYRSHWQQRIDARFPATVPCAALDLFGGSGTMATVAADLGRSAVVIDLNDDYVEIAKRRTDVTPGLALY